MRQRDRTCQVSCFEYIYNSVAPLPADKWTQQKIERDHVRDHQHGHVDDRNRVGDPQSRYRAGLPRFGGEGGPVLRGWQTTPWRPRCHLPSEALFAGLLLTAWLAGSPVADVMASAVQLECTRDPACSF